MCEYTNKTFTDEKIEKKTVSGRIFQDCDFKNCKFEEVIYNQCVFSACKFIKTTFSNVSFKNCKINDILFSECVFVGFVWGEIKSRTNNNIITIELEKCSYIYNDFSQCDFVKTDFRGSEFKSCNFDDCNLNKSIFKKINFQNTTFNNNNLMESDFRDATNYIIDIRSNKLKNAKFSALEASNMLLSLGIKLEY
ncbi:MAG: pentapeptide repeat-containing protein [Clostridia bacterium]